MASLSAREGSSPAATLADRMTHMSHRFTLTDLRSARLRGEPWTLISACKFTDNYSYVEDGDFGKVLQCFPFPLYVIHVPHQNHVFELVIMEVRGSERHHQVPQANHGALQVSKQADNHVTIEDSHGGLVRTY